MNPIIPEFNIKASALVETIRNAAAHISKRVNLLAAAGISLVINKLGFNYTLYTNYTNIFTQTFFYAGGYRSRP